MSERDESKDRFIGVNHCGEYIHSRTTFPRTDLPLGEYRYVKYEDFENLDSELAQLRERMERIEAPIKELIGTARNGHEYSIPIWMWPIIAKIESALEPEAKPVQSPVLQYSARRLAHLALLARNAPSSDLLPPTFDADFDAACDVYENALAAVDPASEAKDDPDTSGECELRERMATNCPGGTLTKDPVDCLWICQDCNEDTG